VICLLSANWEASPECKTEFRTAENLNKLVFCARLEPDVGEDFTGEWQYCDLFGGDDAVSVDIGEEEPVTFNGDGLRRLMKGIERAGIGVASFPWPPPSQPDRAPYRGWEPFEDIDAGVFFGRDAELVLAMDALRGMRQADKTLFVVLGPSGTGKSSFLRAGLLPRLRRDDRNFLILDIVRPQRNVITGETGLAQAIYAARTPLGLATPSLGEIKNACLGDAARVGALLREAQRVASAQLLVGCVSGDRGPAACAEVHDSNPGRSSVRSLDARWDRLGVGGSGPAESPRFTGRTDNSKELCQATVQKSSALVMHQNCCSAG
jgi:hypothetical protein